MIAILIKKGIKYDCNANSESDRIWLQSLSKLTKYDCYVVSHCRVTWLRFLNESRENKFSIITVIFGPFWKRLQSYMVRFKIDFAIIFGPRRKYDCNHLYGPFQENYCNHMWSSPISTILGLTSLLVVDSRGDDQREIDHLRSQCELKRCSDICQVDLGERSVTCSCLGNQILKNNKCTNQCAPDQFMCTDRSGTRFDSIFTRNHS